MRMNGIELTQLLPTIQLVPKHGLRLPAAPAWDPARRHGWSDRQYLLGSDRTLCV